MPTPVAERREDAVIALVVADLVRSGSSLTLLDRPERGPGRADGLTVDAELAVDGARWAIDVTTHVDGARWAIDVTTLRWYQGLEGAVQKLTARLTREFGDQLEAAGMTLVVTCHVSTDERTIRSLVELARQAVESGQTHDRGDEDAALLPWSPELRRVAVQPWLGQSANLVEEIVLSSGEALGKKLRGQLPHARGLGYRTCLAIDQNGSPDLKFGGNFLPQPVTIVAAVTQLETAAGASCDILVLVQGDIVHWLRR